MFLLLGLLPLACIFVFPHVLGLQPFGFEITCFWILVSWLIIWIYQSTAEAANIRDEEPLGTYVTKAYYYEPWEEEVLVTETETVSDEDGGSHEVEVSHWETVYHPEEFEIYLANGGCESVSSTTYKRCVSLFQNETFAEIDRDDTDESHILQDGGCYYSVWPETRDTLLHWYVMQSYENRTLRNPNVYKTADLPQETISRYNLQKYRKASIYGNLSNKETNWLEDETVYFNCFEREDKIKLNFICLKDAPISQADLWRQYWKNGKRNTVNVVLGIKKKKIEWCQTFGWQNETLHVELRSLIMSHAKEGLNGLAAHFDEIKQLIGRTYMPADFSKYDFIQIQYSGAGIAALALCLTGMLFGAVYIFAPEIDRNQLAQEAWNLGNVPRALRLIEEHLGRYPDDAVMRNKLAVVLGWENKWTEAASIWDQMLADTKLNQPIIQGCLLVNKAKAESALGKHKSSIEHLRKALKRDPSLDKYYHCSLRREYEQLKYTNSIKRLDYEFKKQFKKNAAQECAKLYKENNWGTCSFSGIEISMHSRFYRWWQKL